MATANSAAAQVALGEGAKKPEAASPAPGSTPSPVPAKPGPSAILPDDTRTQIRAEDFLPFFQAPGARPAAAPGTLPPSSATYTQTPK